MGELTFKELITKVVSLHTDDFKLFVSSRNDFNDGNYIANFTLLTAMADSEAMCHDLALSHSLLIMKNANTTLDENRGVVLTNITLSAKIPLVYSGKLRALIEQES